MSSIPDRVGPYLILEPLGQGGMGIVYRAEHPQQRGQVALKTVRIPTAGFLQSIRREVTALAQIDHPGIVRILDQGVDQGLPWYTMELLEGQTLKQWSSELWGKSFPVSITESVNDFNPAGSETGWTGKNSQQTVDQASEKEKSALTKPVWWTHILNTVDMSVSEDQTNSNQEPAPDISPQSFTGLMEPAAIESNFKTALTMVRRLCAPLSFLHGAGIVHRDLKPDNILVRPNGRPVIMDFGLMTQVGGGVSRETLSALSSVSGTIFYIAPEQILGQFVDARADLYALGCLLYELLSGRPPFQGETVTTILNGHLYSTPTKLSELSDLGFLELDELFSRLLAKNPADRFGYAQDVASALADLGAGNGLVESEVTASPYLYRSGFTGRKNQMQTLVQCLDRLELEQGGLILLAGESGVGKTRLAMEVARTAVQRQMLVLTGECQPAGGNPLGALQKPLQAIADRCRQSGVSGTDKILGPRGKVLAVYEPALSDLPGQAAYEEPGALTADASRLRLFSYLAETFQALSEEDSVLLIIDDLQWADELSILFLKFMIEADRLAHTSLLFIGTVRSEESSHSMAELLSLSAVQTLDLNRLGESEVRVIVSNMLAIPNPPQQFTRFLARHSEGNPFFVAEYLRTSLEAGLLWRDERGYWQITTPGKAMTEMGDYEELPLPRSLQDLVARRITGLQSASLNFLQTAAVVGREASSRLIQQVACLPESELLPAMDELLKRHIIHESKPGLICFSHDKIREVTYDSLPPERRRQLHHQTATKIEQIWSDELTAHTVSLAHHYDQAAVPDQAVTWYQRAGEQAVQMYAHADAVAYFTRALQLADDHDLSRRYHLLQARVSVYDILNEHQAQEHDLNSLETIATSMDNDRWRAAVKNRQANYALKCDDYPAAINTARTAVEYARTAHDLVLEANGYSIWGRALCLQGHFDQARQHHEQALQLATEAGNLQSQANSLQNLGIDHYEMGDAFGARDYYEQALVLHRRLNDRRGEAQVLNCLGNVWSDMAQLDTASQYLEQSLALKRSIGDKRGEAETLYNLAVNYYGQGNENKARQCCQKSLAISHQIIDPRLEAYILTYLALILENPRIPEQASPTDLESAAHYYDQALTIRRRINQPTLAIDCLAGLARVTLQQGKIKESLQYVEETLSWITDHGWAGIGDVMLVYLAAYRTLDTSGSKKRADTVLDQAQQLVQQWAEDQVDETDRQAVMETWVNKLIIQAWQERQG
ncbi:tetratricopeptide repeat protein [candidate division CSSED10-310 bacterium]|uniref:Tetratricopeptide repeat protein n=1 Tax=candidate division CSSED10-310 bacterium TaxID=2855610 RepID=A0ABV6Z2N4_UNCC1